MTGDALGRRTKQERLHSVSAVRSHDDQFGVRAFRVRGDFDAWVPYEHDRMRPGRSGLQNQFFDMLLRDLLPIFARGELSQNTRRTVVERRQDVNDVQVVRVLDAVETGANRGLAVVGEIDRNNDRVVLQWDHGTQGIAGVVVGVLSAQSASLRRKTSTEH